MLEGYKLKNKNVFPPGGYYFIEKNGTKIIGSSFENLLIKVYQYRAANPHLGLTIDKFLIEREVEEFTCKRLNYDPNYCQWGEIIIQKRNKTAKGNCGACPQA